MTVDVQTLVERCLCERREDRINALVDSLRRIASMGPDKEPKPQPGSDSDVLLAYEDGYAEASYEAAKEARDAIADWEVA